MKAYLCMKPVKLTVHGTDTVKPKDVLHLLAVYRTMTAARKVHGRNAPLMRVEVDERVRGRWRVVK